MVGATPEEAADAFLAPLRRAVWWLTDEPLLQLPADARGRAFALAFPSGHATLESRLGYRLRWRVSHVVRMVEAAGERGPWTVATIAYFYEFRLHDGRELIAYHWHPVGASAITWPHAHFHTLTAPVDLSGGHFPTGRVSHPSVVRYAIMDLKVSPLQRPRQPRPRESTILAQLAAAIQAAEE